MKKEEIIKEIKQTVKEIECLIFGHKIKTKEEGKYTVNCQHCGKKDVGLDYLITNI